MNCRLYAITRICLCILLFIVVAHLPARSQEHTVGLYHYNDSLSFAGYTLFAPMGHTTTYLIDNYGRLIHSWPNANKPASSVYLLENGNLLRTVIFAGVGSVGRGVQEIAWDGTVVWSFQHTTDSYTSHHDAEPLPNGNVLLLAREKVSSAEALAAGRDPLTMSDDFLWATYVIEVEPTGPTSGNIVWEWHTKDHLVQDYDSSADNYGVPSKHPELIDINYVIGYDADWIHGNSVQYNEDLDQVVICSRHFGELWVIDHSTTAAEAAGHSGGASGMGGDILYRWGNPLAYRAGTAADQKLFGQHDVQWISKGLPGEGHLLAFNNGWNRPEGTYSSVEEIITPVDGHGGYPLPDEGVAHGPAEAEWTYVADPPTSFYSGTISGVQRLPNGNTLICSGRPGLFFEITPAGETVWQYVNPVTYTGPVKQGVNPFPGANNVFRVRRYAPDYPGLAGRDLTPKAAVEIYDITIENTELSLEVVSSVDTVVVTSRIYADSGVSQAWLHLDVGEGYASLAMRDDGLGGDEIAGDSVYTALIPPQTGGATVSYYVSAANASAGTLTDPAYAPSISVYKYSVVQLGCCVGLTGNVNCDAADVVDISDLTTLVNHLFVTFDVLCCPEEANTNGSTDCAVDISDLTKLVNHLFVTFEALEQCNPNCK